MNKKVSSLRQILQDFFDNKFSIPLTQEQMVFISITKYLQ